MLAGCSSTLLSPRHRLRSEASAQFQACNYPSMSTQRLDIPCNFPRKDSSRSQPVRPVGISIEKPLESRTSNCSLQHKVQREKKDELWESKNSKSLKRYAEQGWYDDDDDDSCVNRAKRKRGCNRSDEFDEGRENLNLGKLGSGNFWYRPNFESVPLFAGLNPVRPQLPFSLSCSGEEERVVFAPNEVISQPLRNNPWVGTIVNEIADLGEKNVESSSQRQRVVKEASGSSSSSDSQSLDLGLNENIFELERGKNGSNPPNPNEISQNQAFGVENNGEKDGFELISLLVACVEAIGLKNIAGVNHFIAKLGELASPRGSPISRLTAYFTEALTLRVSRIWPNIFHVTTPRELINPLEEDSGTALRLFNQVTPILKFIHFTSNEILLRGFEGKDRVHIIDFDIKQGLQWPSFFQSLASRTNPPSHVRITGIGESKQDLIETGERLSGFANALNIQFEFHPVVDRLEDVRLWMLHVKEGETVAVNCIFQLHKLLYDPTGGALSSFLGLIRSTNPRIVVMAEQEAEHNEHILERRLCNSLKYYSALFDSVDSALPVESPARIKIEELFAREIRNIIACEGRDRFERHIGFGQWRKLMEQGRFKCEAIKDREYLQSQMLLRMYNSFNNYKVRKQGEDGAGITLSWLDQQPLYTVSAWAPFDIASVPGSSLSHHHHHLQEQ